MSNNSCLKFTRENITLRRERVLQLAAQGMTQQEICNELGNVVSRPLIALDLQYLKCRAADTIDKYTTEFIPFEWSKTLEGFNIIIREAYKLLEDKSTENKDKISLMSLLMDAYDKRMQLVTGSVVIDNAKKIMTDMQQRLERQQQEQPRYSEVF
jgi:hypothetical protein